MGYKSDAQRKAVHASKAEKKAAAKKIDRSFKTAKEKAKAKTKQVSDEKQASQFHTFKATVKIIPMKPASAIIPAGMQKLKTEPIKKTNKPLSPKQKKMDLNKNGVIDADDLKRLRSGSNPTLMMKYLK